MLDNEINTVDFHKTETILNNQELDKERKNNLVKTLQKYTNMFNGRLGYNKNIIHYIELHKNETFKFAPYKIPYKYYDGFKTEILRLLKLNVIEPCRESKFISPCFVIKKKDGTFRLLVDFRKLNSLTILPTCVMPTFQDIVIKVRNSKFFTKLDFNSGYYQPIINPKDRFKTCFATPF